MNERVYAIYRRNLRRNQHLKPGKARQLHHLERALFSWPAKLYVYWHHVKHRTKPTQTPSGVFFNAQKEPDDRAQ